MLFVVTVGTDEFEVLKIIVFPVSILMMNLQNLKLCKPAPLATLPSLFKQAQFDHADLLRFVARLANFYILYPLCACSSTFCCM